MTGLFDATMTLEPAWIPKGQMDDFFPIGEGIPDLHQQEMLEALFHSDCEAIMNTNPTGSGKTLSWAGPIIRSPEFGDPWIVLATYPTKALVEDQRETIYDLFELYYQDDDYDSENGFEYQSTPEGRGILTDGATEYRIEDRVIEITSDSTRGQDTSDAILDGYDEAVEAYFDGIPTIFLTTPDTLSLLATNRFSDNDAVGIPGMVDAIIVDEFHLANPRGKHLLPFHLDVYRSLADNQDLKKLVFLSATPVPGYVNVIESAFDTETVSRHVFPIEPGSDGRKILPETRLRITSRPMFTNGTWLTDNIASLIDFYNSNGQMVVILDSVREVEKVANQLEWASNLDIGRIYGWKTAGRERAVEESDILVGNTAVEVGVDFDDVNRVVFTAYGASSAIQRLGRMRHSSSLEDFQSGIITTPETHYGLLEKRDESGYISRDDFENVLYTNLSQDMDRPYYTVLCAAYAKYLWSDAGSGRPGVKPLSEMYSDTFTSNGQTREDQYKDLVHTHFADSVDELSGEVPDTDEFWMYLDQIKEQYRENGSYPVLEEMHTFRPSSLSCVIIDTTDSEEPLKNYGLHYVLRYCDGRVLDSKEEAQEVFRSEFGRDMTETETRFFDEVSRYGCGFFLTRGKLDDPRDYWIGDFALIEQESQNWAENPIQCQPRVMTDPTVQTNPPVEGLPNLEVAEENVLMQFVGDTDSIRSRFGLGPYASSVLIEDTGLMLLWQDGVLAHSRLMYEHLNPDETEEQATLSQY